MRYVKIQKMVFFFLTGVFLITNSLNIGMSFVRTDKDQKHMIWKRFVVHSCNGCLIAPLTDCTHTLKHYKNISTGRVYIDVKDGKGYTGELEK